MLELKFAIYHRAASLSPVDVLAEQALRKQFRVVLLTAEYAEGDRAQSEGQQALGICNLHNTWLATWM